jgi:hypothetical protein
MTPSRGKTVKPITTNTNCQILIPEITFHPFICFLKIPLADVNKIGFHRNFYDQLLGFCLPAQVYIITKSGLRQIFSAGGLSSRIGRQTLLSSEATLAAYTQPAAWQLKHFPGSIIFLPGRKD